MYYPLPVTKSKEGIMAFIDGLTPSLSAQNRRSKPERNRPKSKKSSTRKGESNGALVFLYLLLAATVIALFASKISFTAEADKMLPNLSDKIQIANENQIAENPPAQSIHENNDSNQKPLVENKEIINVEEGKKEIDKSNEKNVEKDTIRVLNGTSIKGMANQISKQLKEAGFSVRTIGDAKYDYKETIVYYDKNKEQLARKIAQTLSNRKTHLKQSDIVKPDDILVVAGEN